MSFLKMRLKSLGVPETRMNTLQPEDLVGTDVVITVKKNGESTNITKVEIYTGSYLSSALFNTAYISVSVMPFSAQK